MKKDSMFTLRKNTTCVIHIYSEKITIDCKSHGCGINALLQDKKILDLLKNLGKL